MVELKNQNMRKTEENNSRVVGLIKQVHPLLEQKQSKKALTKLKKILKLSPNHLYALVWSAEILVDNDEVEKAEIFFDRAIKLNKNFLRALHGRALLRYKLEKFPDALVDFNKLIELRPNIPESYINRGNVFLSKGEFAEALEDFDSALALNPKLASAVNGRGLVNHKLGNKKLALEDFNASILIKNDFTGAIFNRGNVLKDMGRPDEALEDYKRVLQLVPNFASAFSNRGTIKKIRGDFTGALKDFNAAIHLDETFQGAYYNRGSTWKELRQFNPAIKDLTIAIGLNPKDANAYNVRGNVFKEIFKPEKAVADFEKAIELQPNSADAYNNRGIVYSEMRRSKEALCDFEKAISISPYMGATHRQISILKKYTKSDPHIETMQALLSDKKMSPDDTCHLLYALAKSYEDVGEIREAFDYYSRGGKLKKKLIKYRASQDEKYFNFVSAKMKRFLECPVKETNDGAIKPIFIIGMPRSGTSLIEQIISSHPKVFGAGELPFWGFYTARLFRGELQYNMRTVTELRKKYSSQIIEVVKEKRFVTDKMPNNFLSLGLIKSAFPEAKLIHVKREAAAVCWSNFANYFAGSSLGHSYTLEDTVRYYLQYEKLMGQWKNYLQSEIYEISYDNLTNDPGSEIRRLIEHLELPWDNLCLLPQKNSRAVRTASMSQIGKPIYKNSSASWKKYSSLIGNKFDRLTNFDHHSENK